MATQIAETAGGEEEVYELEEGVLVRKTGGVKLPPRQSINVAEIQAQMEQQRILIEQLRVEAQKARQQARIHRELESESIELRLRNEERMRELSQETQRLENEVQMLIEKERELEARRAEAHRQALEMESERVKAKTAEIMAREEAKEAARLEEYHHSYALTAEALATQKELEVREAEMKLEQLQFRMQYGDVQPAYSVPKAKIIVEVKPRKILEARQYETSQLGPSYATAEIEERGLEEARQEAVTAVRIEKEKEKRTTRKRKETTTSAVSAAEGETTRSSRDIKLAQDLRGTSSTVATAVETEPETQTTQAPEALKPDTQKQAPEIEEKERKGKRPSLGATIKKFVSSVTHGAPRETKEAQ